MYKYKTFNTSGQECLHIKIEVDAYIKAANNKEPMNWIFNIPALNIDVNVDLKYDVDNSGGYEMPIEAAVVDRRSVDDDDEHWLFVDGTNMREFRGYDSHIVGNAIVPALLAGIIENLKHRLNDTGEQNELSIIIEADSYHFIVFGARVFDLKSVCSEYYDKSFEHHSINGITDMIFDAPNTIKQYDSQLLSLDFRNESTEKHALLVTCKILPDGTSECAVTVLSPTEL